MNNTKIKTFWRQEDIEINKWLSDNPDIEIISHSYNVVLNDATNRTFTGSQIIYKEINAKKSKQLNS